MGIDGGAGREELIRINKANAATTVVGPNGLAAYPHVGALDIGPSGTFWAVNYDTDYTLLSINPTTGAPTEVGVIGGLSAPLFTI